jgi:acyl-CoA reductase-like NAD-dependent aldehyde dehydrogenase
VDDATEGHLGVKPKLSGVMGEDGSTSKPDLLAACRAQANWSGLSVKTRLQVIRRLRQGVANDPRSLARTVEDLRPPADTIAAEILPLVEAARFLERMAPALLAPRRLRGGRPLWLAGIAAEIHREPLGVVLILAPSNYPIMLPGIQALQAIAAGNAVRVKPARGFSGAMRALQAALRQAGLPDGVFDVLDDSDAAGAAAVAAGFDKIVLTGSAATGARVLAAAADMLTPTTMELSGCDAMFVLAEADLDLVADCLAYGLRFNAGATCIAPRRVFVAHGMAATLEAAIVARIGTIPPVALGDRTAGLVTEILADARARGARVLGATDPRDFGPVVIAAATAGSRATMEDVFAPVVSLIAVDSVDAALAADRSCPYALGASVFGPERAARELVPHLRAGSVVVNDVIVPTADPRLPFGGRGRSGFGVTRGAEGLLEMTTVKSVSVRRGRFRPHLQPKKPGDEALMVAMTRLLHGPWRARAGAFGAFIRATRETRAPSSFSTDQPPRSG